MNYKLPNLNHLEVKVPRYLRLVSKIGETLGMVLILNMTTIILESLDQKHSGDPTVWQRHIKSLSPS